jgi:uncharacterized membrane protein SirB2
MIITYIHIFKALTILKLWKRFVLKNSKYVSKSQNFKNPLPHVNGV